MAVELINNPKIISKLDLFSAWTESQMAYKGQPGISVGLVFDQELFWVKGFGYADLEEKKAAEPETIYRIASITKLFTSTAILQLRDAGKLQLDDPIKKYLDWFDVEDNFEDDPQILIRHLITHTSGLPREAGSPYWSTADFPTYEKIKELLPKQLKILPTETRWKYSNLAVSLAGMIVAAVSGMEYETYVEKNILEPLGMKNTHVNTLDPENPLFAKKDMDDVCRMEIAVSDLFGDCKGITPAANMATNVVDLAEFVKLQFRNLPAGGKQILKGSTLKEMHTVHWLDTDWQSGWGWGFQVMRISGKTLIGHGGSLMGYRTMVMMNPEEKFGVVVLTNSDDGNPLYYAEKLFAWVAPAVAKAAAKKEDKKEPGKAWGKFVGKYRVPWGDTQIMLLDDELVAIDPSLPDPSVDIIKFIPISENVFRIKMKAGFGAPEEIASFDLDDEGNVVRLNMGDGYSYPVQDW